MKKPLLIFAFLLLACLAFVPASAQGKHIAMEYDFVVALQWDGTVKAVGDNEYGQCDTDSWRSVVAVDAGFHHTLGLKNDGTVYAVGDNEYGQCEVKGWRDIVMVVAEGYDSYGLTRDGRVLSTSRDNTKANRDIAGWKDIVWIGGPEWYLYAIDKDGRGYGAGHYQLDIRDAAQIDVSNDGIYVLKRDGTVVYDDSYCDPPIFTDPHLLDWQDVVEIDCWGRVLGIRRDGTMADDIMPRDYDGWRDIAEVEGDFAVRADGSVLFTDSPDFSDLDWEEICAWRVMVDPARAKELNAPAIGKAAASLPENLIVTANAMRLRGQVLAFEAGSKYAVYSGPGREYLRGGAGKAFVSTKGEICVYGVESGWALIAYTVSGKEQRFGYIPARALPVWAMDSKRFKLMNLHARGEAAQVLRDTHVTGGPGGLGAALSFLKAGQEGVLYLGALDEKWAYVQAETGEGVPFRGFVPMADVERGGEPAAKVCIVPEGYNAIWTNASSKHHFFDAKADYFVVPDDAQAVSLPSSIYLTSSVDDLIALPGLRSIEVAAQSTDFSSIDGVLYSKYGGVLLLYPSGRTQSAYVLPEGTESAKILANAVNITSILMPSAMTDAGGLAYLPSLQSYEVAEGNEKYKAVDGVLFSKDGSVLIAYPAARPGDTYTVPIGTKEIGMSAFPDTSLARHVILPKGLEVIDMNAFDDNKSLESVVFPDTLTDIGEGAFNGCAKLKSVNLPESLEHISYCAFAWSGLEGELHIPEGVTFIDARAVEEIGISDLYLPSSLDNWSLYYSYGPDEDAPDGWRGPTVHAPRGSWAAEFARENGLLVVLEEP